MAVSQQNADRANDCIEALNNSPLPGALKEDLRAVVRSTAEGTNGLSPEEKQKAIAQGLFDLARITIYNMIHEAKTVRTWKDVIVECRVVLCILAGIIAVILILRPEIADAIASAVGSAAASRVSD